MKKDFPTLVRTCLSRLLEPVASFCIARGVHFQDFVELAKQQFLAAAERKLISERRDVTTSRLSVMTGLQRPEVNRIQRGDIARESRDFTARIVGQWVSDRRFRDRKKKPKALSTAGLSSDFAKLVASVSKDLNPHTVRFELERLGLIEHENGVARLVHPAYVSSGDPATTIRLGAEDARDLLESVQENAFSPNVMPNLHARTYYDNVPDEAVPAVRQWFIEFGRRIHDEARTFMSKFDRDISRRHSGSGRNRVVLGTFSRVERLEDESDTSES